MSSGGCIRSDIMEKTCCVCKETKPLNEFRKEKGKSYDRAGMCKLCKRELERLWREENREKIKERQRDYYKKHQEEIKQKRKDNYDPKKSKARGMVREIKKEKCIFCENIGEKHHSNYDEPTNIVFLCKSHHKQVHDGTLSI